MLAGLHQSYGNVQFELGDLGSAVRQYEQASAINERLAAEFPDVWRYAVDACSDHITCTKHLETLGEVDAARTHVYEAMEIAAKLARDYPDVPRVKVAWLHAQLIKPLRDLGDLDAARAHDERASAFYDELRTFRATPVRTK
jgi:tetratricopeptide (TPR) repeat protein